MQCLIRHERDILCYEYSVRKGKDTWTGDRWGIYTEDWEKWLDWGKGDLPQPGGPSRINVCWESLQGCSSPAPMRMCEEKWRHYERVLWGKPLHSKHWTRIERWRNFTHQTKKPNHKKHFKRSIPKGRMPIECGKCGAETFGDTNHALPAVLCWPLNFSHLPHLHEWQFFLLLFNLIFYFLPLLGA